MKLCKFIGDILRDIDGSFGAADKWRCAGRFLNLARDKLRGKSQCKCTMKYEHGNAEKAPHIGGGGKALTSCDSSES